MDKNHKKEKFSASGLTSSCSEIPEFIPFSHLVSHYKDDIFRYTWFHKKKPNYGGRALVLMGHSANASIVTENRKKVTYKKRLFLSLHFLHFLHG
ncbi:hypothetical protein HMF3257_26425 [Spirosoma telluris]|uniref:Uncharacterized protein n=1 Tax=Spirosoma telluris TaxID=2183553 RepID=A0A327NQ18_9BACT|nr:hypothetical protein HMF3257_26425 [Spirosoma telluris]